MLYLLHGNNTYDSWASMLQITTGDFSSLDGATFDNLDKFTALTSNLPLFAGEQKTLVVKRLFENKKKTIIEKLLQYLQENNPGVDIIFWEARKADARTKLFAYLKKNGKLMEFDFLKPYELVSWISKASEKLGFTIDRMQAEAIIAKAGTDQFILSSEMEKLSLLLKAVKRSKLETKDLGLVSKTDLSGDVWQLVDSLTSRDRKKVLFELNRLLREQRDYSYVISMLARQLKLLYLLKREDVPEAAISKSFGFHPYVISKAKRELHKFSRELLSRLFAKLAGLDLAIKEGKIEPRLGLNLLLASI